MFNECENVIHQLAHEIYIKYCSLNRKKLTLQHNGQLLKQFGLQGLIKLDKLDDINRVTLWRRKKYIQEYHEHQNDMINDLIDLPLQGCSWCFLVNHK